MINVPVQVSVVVPQLIPWSLHSLTNGGGRQTLLMHVLPAAQAPHSSVAPQPSEMVLQVAPFATQVVGLHCVHMLVTASHTSPVPLHLPQSIKPPQPSEIFPHRPIPRHLPAGSHTLHLFDEPPQI